MVKGRSQYPGKMLAGLKRGVVRPKISELERQLKCVLKSVPLDGINNL